MKPLGQNGLWLCEPRAIKPEVSDSLLGHKSQVLSVHIITGNRDLSQELRRNEQQMKTLTFVQS